MHKSLLSEIKTRKSADDIEQLTSIIDMLLDTIKETNVDFYKHIESILYEMINGKHLTRELAEKLVTDMKPAGEHWTYAETTNVKDSMGYGNIRPEDFYIVMNMAYNDYNSMFGNDTNMYAKYAYLFIADEDAQDDKVYRYFMA